MTDQLGNIGGIVLCGGHSRRMGHAKALLPFGTELMLQRVVRLISEVVEPIVVVAAARQDLPQLPANVLIARDERPDEGPLEGLAAGLKTLQGRRNAAFVTSCDVPLLRPAFVARMADLLTDHDAAVPVDEAFHHPLAAVYRVTVLGQVEELLASGQRRPRFLFDRVRTRRVPLEALRVADPNLDSLANLNHPAEYFSALKRAGCELPSEVAQQLEQDIDE